ncbi:MAG: PEPxxWA-CTERM sorting domain-containing protein [Phenylobacterium sp.]
MGASADATTLLEVSGAGTAGQVLDQNTAAAVSFTLDQAYANVAISADVLCVNCTGEVLLMKDLIGPGATLSNCVTGSFFNVSTQTSPLLSGLNLGAGTYFLMLAITGDTGGGGWIGSAPATVTTLPGITHGLDLFADNVASPSFNSNFQVILSSSALHYSITADLGDSGSAIPEPAAWALMIAGFGLAGLRLRGRRLAPG